MIPVDKLKEISANELEYLEDGFIYYWSYGIGAYSAQDLRDLADFIDLINKPAEDQLNSYYEKQMAKDTSNDTE